jgi:DNA-binding MarR family transcriptional regulator
MIAFCVDINLYRSMPKVKTVPFETTLQVRDTCLCLHVQRAARSLARRFDEALRPYGLTSGQFSLLMSLNRPAPPAMKDVADLLAMDRTTLTAALKPLARNGWVKIAPSKTDKRSKQLSLTAKGMAVLADAVPVWKTEHAALNKLLDAGALRAGLMALV